MCARVVVAVCLEVQLVVEGSQESRICIAIYINVADTGGSSAVKLPDLEARGIAIGANVQGVVEYSQISRDGITGTRDNICGAGSGGAVEFPQFGTAVVVPVGAEIQSIVERSKKAGDARVSIQQRVAFVPSNFHNSVPALSLLVALK